MRQKMMLMIAAFLLGIAGHASAMETERWGIFELTFSGPSTGNPFVDVQLSAEFSQGDATFTPEGFYDGGGVYKVRFMPNATGPWTFVTKSNRAELDGKRGSFTCTEAKPGNHGPVRVHNTFQFAYDDGTPHFSIGTTCYAWAHQDDAMERQTLETLESAPFNKMRMCVFPKSYTYNKNEPPLYAYEGKPLREWDFQRFQPAFWQHFEQRVGQLRDRGIEADLILFHPYDRWGFRSMGHDNDLLYLRYAVARLAAYRNVWWSFANEYDLMKWPVEQWDEYMKLVQEIDPYDHLRGIHNCREWYDHTKPWVTHCSIQNSDFRQTKEVREKYKKPAVYDECRYEGNIPMGWGNISAEQMVRNFWMGSLSGCYVGHGETYEHPEDVLWWSKGGVLHGQSPARIQFLKDLIEDLPYQQMQPDFSHYPQVYTMAKPGECYLIYFADKTEVSIDLPGADDEGGDYKVDAIDTWQMKTVPIGSAGAGRFTFTPPKPDFAVRLTRYAPGERRRPEAKAAADKNAGIAPLTVRFSTPWKQTCHWEFGDESRSAERSPVHTFSKPGLYTVTLTVTDEDGVAGCAVLPVFVDRDTDDPIVRFGFPGPDSPSVTLHGGKVTKADDGTYELGSDEPFSWIQVGDGPIEELDGARSFTVTGWLKASSMKVGQGGNRILFSLQYNDCGIDLVHHADGRMRLAVNQWPDQIQNDSSPGGIAPGKWVFFAVTYDATKDRDNVCWYFGDENRPARLDRNTSYKNGPVGAGSGDLVIGNFNRTLQGAGLDRQFRGQIRGLRIHASRLDGRGAHSIEKIRDLQTTPTR